LFKLNQEDQMKNLLLAILITMSSSIAAQDLHYTLNCVGFDNNSNRIDISHDEDSLKNTVNIDGKLIKIIGKTKNGLGIVTENFINAYGDTVYVALVPFDYERINMYQIYTTSGDIGGQSDRLNYQVLLFGSLEDGHGYRGSYITSRIFEPLNQYRSEFMMKFSSKPFYR
jgi:hypothetical protein